MFWWPILDSNHPRPLKINAEQVRSHELRADVLRVAPALQDRDGVRTAVNEGLVRWTYEGRTGYGICEYLHQLDEHGRPLVPIE